MIRIKLPFYLLYLPPGNYVLNYLYTGAKTASYVEEALMLLFARITKLSWFENAAFKEVVPDISKFLQVCFD